MVNSSGDIGSGCIVATVAVVLARVALAIAVVLSADGGGAGVGAVAGLFGRQRRWRLTKRFHVIGCRRSGGGLRKTAVGAADVAARERSPGWRRDRDGTGGVADGLMDDGVRKTDGRRTTTATETETDKRQRDVQRSGDSNWIYHECGDKYKFCFALLL